MSNLTLRSPVLLSPCDRRSTFLHKLFMNEIIVIRPWEMFCCSKALLIHSCSGEGGGPGEGKGLSRIFHYCLGSKANKRAVFSSCANGSPSLLSGVCIYTTGDSWWVSGFPFLQLILVSDNGLKIRGWNRRSWSEAWLFAERLQRCREQWLQWADMARRGEVELAAAPAAVPSWTQPWWCHCRSWLLKAMSGILAIRGMWQAECLSGSFIHSVHQQATKVVHYFLTGRSQGPVSFCLQRSSSGTVEISAAEALEASLCCASIVCMFSLSGQCLCGCTWKENLTKALEFRESVTAWANALSSNGVKRWHY